MSFHEELLTIVEHLGANGEGPNDERDAVIMRNALETMTPESLEAGDLPILIGTLALYVIAYLQQQDLTKRQFHVIIKQTEELGILQGLARSLDVEWTEGRDAHSREHQRTEKWLADWKALMCGRRAE